MSTFNFNGTNRTRHNKMREYPSRNKLLLREAITDIGLKVLGWEYLCMDAPHWVWFDAAVEIKGKPCFIFLFDPHVSGKMAHIYKPLNVRCRNRKIDYAKERGIPFIEVRSGSKDKIRAQIELALMFIQRQPYKEAPFRLPKGWNEEGKAMKRKSKDRWQI